MIPATVMCWIVAPEGEFTICIPRNSVGPYSFDQQLGDDTPFTGWFTQPSPCLVVADADDVLNKTLYVLCMHVYTVYTHTCTIYVVHKHTYSVYITYLQCIYAHTTSILCIEYICIYIYICKYRIHTYIHYIYIYIHYIYI